MSNRMNEAPIKDHWIALFLSIPVLLLLGFVLADHWQWFIVPAFKVPGLSYGEALGLSIFLNFVAACFSLKMPVDEDPIYRVFIKLGVVLATWLIGWVYAGLI